jgi:hypothetical protein
MAQGLRWPSRLPADGYSLSPLNALVGSPSSVAQLQVASFELFRRQ